MTPQAREKIGEALKTLTHFQRIIPELKKSLEELRSQETQTRTQS